MVIGLVKGRHEIPEVDGQYIFDGPIDPVNVSAANKIARDRIKYFSRKTGDMHVDIYVTGLTMALVSVLNVCRIHHLTVTLWHYNKETDNYFPQAVI